MNQPYARNINGVETRWSGCFQTKFSQFLAPACGVLYVRANRSEKELPEWMRKLEFKKKDGSVVEMSVEALREEFSEVM